MTIQERIAKYIAATPSATSGAGGHGQTFTLACTLFNGFALDELQVFNWLAEYNARCQPPWTEKELWHKVKSAATVTHSKPRGHLVSANGQAYPTARPAPIFNAKPLPLMSPEVVVSEWLRRFACTEQELFERSPVPLCANWEEDGVLLLRTLFNPGEKINFVTEFKIHVNADGEAKANPTGFGETVERDELVERWHSGGMPKSEAGGWMRINPMDNGITDLAVQSFRHALIEFDTIPLALQLSFLARIKLPIAAILTSGGKSVHAWVRLDADNFDEYTSAVSIMRDALTPYGIDRANKNPARLSRLVGVTRDIGGAEDPRQRLIYLNADPAPHLAIFNQ